MKIHGVLAIGGKQFLCEAGDELLVEHIDRPIEETFEVPVLMTFDEAGTSLDTAPKKPAQIQVLEQLKGDKIRVAKFKSKVRYRKVRGFRPQLTRVKVLSI